MSVALARKNVFHQKGKMILSILSIGASLAMILILLGFREGLYAALTAYINNLNVDLIVAQDGVSGLVSSSSVLPSDIHGQLEDLAQAQEAGHIVVAGVIFNREDTKTPVVLIGYDPQAEMGQPWRLGEGRYLQAKGEILLDTWLAQRSGVKVGDRVDLLGREFKVVGFTRGTSSWMSPYVFIPLEDAQETLGLNGAVSFHLLRLRQGADRNLAIQVIKSHVQGVDVIRPDTIAETDRRVIAAVMDRPIVVLLLVAIIIGVAVMGLTAYTAVMNRMREYSLLKALGANSFQLNGIVFKESVYTGVLGLLAGTGLAYLSAFLIMANWPQFNVLIRPQSAFLGAALALVMIVFSSFLPARALGRIDPLLAFKA